MPTYEYDCPDCGKTFERRQTITEPPLSECPECGGRVQRLVSGGSGFILRESGHPNRSDPNGCSLETTGQTCCGRDQRCGKPSCG